MQKKEKCVSSDLTKEINILAPKYKLKYADFVDEICKEFIEEEYLWTVPLISRNIFHDETFINILKLIATRNNEQHYTPCDMEFSLFSRLKTFCRLFFFDLFYFRFKLMIRKYARGHENNIPDDAVIIFTPALSTGFDENGYVDRYFPGIEKYTSRPIFLVPDLVMNEVCSLKEFVTKLLNDPKYSFCLAEQYLPRGFWKEIINFNSICKKIAKEKYIFDGIDVTELIIDSLRKGLFNNAALDGIVYSLFLRELSKRDQKIRTFIIWNEGRPSDIATIAAINKFFPMAKCIACEQFPPAENFLSLHFTRFQNEFFNSSTFVTVPSQYYVQEKKMYDENSRVFVVPILRNRYILAEKKGAHGKKTVLLLLSAFRDANSLIVEAINQYVLENKNIDILVKNHPIYIDKDISFFYDNKLFFSPQYVTGKISDCLTDIDMVVTSSTTSSFEILFGRTPVVIIVPSGKLAYSGIPDEFSYLYKNVYELRDFASAINLYLYDNKELDYEKLNTLFEEPTKIRMDFLFE